MSLDSWHHRPSDRREDGIMDECSLLSDEDIFSLEFFSENLIFIGSERIVDIDK